MKNRNQVAALKNSLTVTRGRYDIQDAPREVYALDPYIHESDRITDHQTVRGFRMLAIGYTRVRWSDLIRAEPQQYGKRKWAKNKSDARKFFCDQDGEWADTRHFFWDLWGINNYDYTDKRFYDRVMEFERTGIAPKICYTEY